MGEEEAHIKEFKQEPKEWNTFVASRKEAHFSHRFEWLQILQDVYGGTPYYLCAREEDGISGVLPIMKRNVFVDGQILVSVPMADEAGVLAKTSQVETMLLNRACALANESGSTYLEVRQRKKPSIEMENDLTRADLELKLPTEADELWDNFRSEIRNRVRKARKSGLTAEVISNDDLHEVISSAFYPVYSENMRDLGSPMHCENFFHTVTENFSSDIALVVVRKEDTVVGGGFGVKYRSTFAVPWVSSLRRYFDLCPNNILYWRLLKYAIDHNCTVFDFGRSPKDSGIYRFKKRWGAEPVQLYYCYKASGQAPTKEKRDLLSYRIFSTIWQRTPLWLARRIGPKIFARLPI